MVENSQQNCIYSAELTDWGTVVPCNAGLAWNSLWNSGWAVLLCQPSKCPNMSSKTNFLVTSKNQILLRGETANIVLSWLLLGSYSVDFGCEHMCLCTDRAWRLPWMSCLILLCLILLRLILLCPGEPGADCVGYTSWSANSKDQPFSAFPAQRCWGIPLLLAFVWMQGCKLRSLCLCSRGPLHAAIFLILCEYSVHILHTGRHKPTF